MDGLKKLKLIETSKTIIKSAYNLNYKQKVKDVYLDCNKHPDGCRGGRALNITYTLHMNSGDLIEGKDCPKAFNSLINHMVQAAYEIGVKPTN